MSITKIDHVNIVVDDLERSVRFYTEVLGFDEIKRAHLKGEWIEQIVALKGVEAKVAYVRAPGGEPRIELLQYISPEGVSLPENSISNTKGLRHIAFQVNNMDQMVARLKEFNIETFAPPVTVPGSVVKHDEGDKSLCYFKDPDGVILELAQYS